MVYEESREFEGRVIAGGKHPLPEFVCADELRHKFWRSHVNDGSVSELMSRKGLEAEYASLKAEVKVAKRSGRLADVEGVVSRRKERFGRAGVKVAVCERRSGSGVFQWIEYADAAFPYVSQYDVSNLDASLPLRREKLKFARGVKVVALDQSSSEIPSAGVAYFADLAQALSAAESKDEQPRWNPAVLGPIVASRRSRFRAQGIDVHLSYKTQARDGPLVWLELVDLTLQPNYVPQRGFGVGARSESSDSFDSVFSTKTGRAPLVRCVVS